MCLHNNPYLARELLDKKASCIFCYKSYCLRSDEKGNKFLIPWWHKSSYRHIEQKYCLDLTTNKIVSDSPRQEVSMEGESIRRGIHVYQSLRHIQDYWMTNSYEIAVKVQCFLSDLLGAERRYEDINIYAFKKVYLTDESWAELLAATDLEFVN